LVPAAKASAPPPPKDSRKIVSDISAWFTACETDLGLARDRNAALETDLRVARDRNAALQTDLRVARDRNAALEEEKAALNAQISALQQSLKECDTALVGEKRKRDKLESYKLAVEEVGKRFRGEH
jgi:chromosome segregation ATPase